MSTGTEATDTAVKIARRFAYKKKGVPDNQAVVLFPKGCFWGRSLTASGGSTNPAMREHNGPFADTGFQFVDYGDHEALDKALSENPNIAAFFIEPIQGEAGVIVPPEGYLAKTSEICKKHNVLLMIDEI